MRDEAGRRVAAMRVAERSLTARGGAQVGVHVDPNVQQGLDGRFVIHARHQYRGVPLFLAASVVHVKGREAEIFGDAERIEVEAIDVVPTVSATEAVREAVAHLQGSPSDDDACAQRHAVLPATKRPRFRTLATFDSASQPTVFSAGPFAAAVTAELTIDASRLAWLITIKTRELEEYVILIGANGSAARRVLFCRDISTSACTGPVFLFDPRETRAMVELPCDLAVYPEPFHARQALVPFRWMDTDRTFGNNVDPRWDNQNIRLTARRVGPDLIFDTPSQQLGRDQCVLNAFFFCNFMHDFFGLLGFGEAEGAFHFDNVTTSGRPRDRLTLALRPTPFTRLGVMDARRDGDRPQMVLGSGSNGHAALEGSVVIHEYVHGVTQRMIGGVNNTLGIVRRQPQALAEAWSDFFAITIQNYYRLHHGVTREEYVFAAWCTGGTARTRSYDGHLATFAAAGSGAFRAAHNAGEIWAAAAIDLARRVVAHFGFRAGYPIAWSTMFESFRGRSGNPTFLDARDALFGAIAARPEASVILPIARETFRSRGMGRNARAPDADRFNTNVENFDPWP